jgi:hypothetical protein
MDTQLDTDTADTMEGCFKAIYIDAPECKQEWQELDRKFQPQSPSLHHPRLLLLSGVRMCMRVCVCVCACVVCVCVCVCVCFCV